MIVFVPIFLLVITIPYFLSSSMLFTLNPGDEAIVNFLGAEKVRPTLLLVLLLGCFLGTFAFRMIRDLFQKVLMEGSLSMKELGMWSRLFMPWFRLVFHIIHEFLTYLLLEHSWDWGALTILYFSFPGFGFIISTSIFYLITYTKVKGEAHKRGLKLEMVYSPRIRGSYRIRLSGPLGL